jgi:hypothetical protein
MTLNAGSSGATLVLGQGGAGIATLNRNLTLSASNIDLTLTRVANTNGALVQLTTGATYDFAFGLRNTTDSDFHLFNYGASFDAFKIARADSAVTFYGTATVLKGVNAIAAGFVAQNTDTGNAAVIRNSLTCGTATGEFNVYSNTHASFANRMRIATNTGQIDFIAGGVLGLNITPSTILIPFTANSTNTSSGSLIVGNGTNGGIGVSGYSYFGEQVNVKSVDSYGGPSFFANNGGVSLAGNAGSSYAAIKAYTNNAGTEKTLAINQSGGAGVNIGGTAAVAGGSLLANGTVTAKDFIVFNGPSLLSTTTARAPLQGLLTDGTTTSSASGVPAFGTGDYTAHMVVRATTATAPNMFLRNGQIGVSTAWIVGTTDASPAGRLSVRNGDASAQLFGNTVLQSGKTYTVTVVRSSGTVTFYLNGVADGSGTLATNYTDTATGFAVMPAAGFIGSPQVYNRALSAAEVLALYESNTPARTDYGLATNDSSATVYAGQQIINGANSTFASGAGWTLAAGNTISGGKLNMVNLAYALCNNTNLRKGIRYRLTITIDSISGGSLRVYDGVNYTGNIGSTIGTKTIEYTMAADAPVFMRMEGGTAVVDDITITPLGLLVAPDADQPGGGLAWYDTSGNNRTITLPATGVSWNVVTSGKINAPLMVGGFNGGAKLNVYTPTTAEVGYLYGIRLSDESTSTLALGLQTPTGTVRPFIHGNVGLGFGTGGVAAVNITSGQQVQVLSTTNATNAASGALLVGDGTNGGLGVSNAIFAGGPIIAGSTLTASGSSVADGIATSGFFGGSKRVVVGYNTTSDYGFVASVDTGVAWKELWLNPVGGLVKTGGGLTVTGPSTFNDNANYAASVRWANLGGGGTNNFINGANVANTIRFGIGDSNQAYLTNTGLQILNLVKIGALNAADSRLHVYESTAADVSNGITIEQAGTGDAVTAFLLTGVQRWSMGIDNSDSDKFKIGTGALGSADRLVIDIAGNTTTAGSITANQDGSAVALYVPGDSALRASNGKLYIDTRVTDGGDIVFRPRVNAALTLAAATGNATFVGNITTGAPAGGTAAAWKLGTVATVSPTAPNRTIEVDIGGTIYYLHAKTTNN